MPFTIAAAYVVVVALDSFLSLFTESKYALSVSPNDRNLVAPMETHIHFKWAACVSSSLNDLYDLKYA